SLYGSTSGDYVGEGGIFPLPNGNFVVDSSSWNNGAAHQAGAVTYVNGATGLVGPVTASNSLVGTSTTDQAGSNSGPRVTVVANGDYVVASTLGTRGWTTGVGAVTFAKGPAGLSGPATASNSLVGTTPSDAVGNGTITPLTNGDYVVSSISWHNGSVAHA